MIRKIACAVSVAALAGCSTAGGLVDTPAASKAVSDPSEVDLVRVIDGDTIVVDDDGEEQKVRFLGIDTPEISHGDGAGEPCGEEAREKTEELTAAGEVELRSDDTQPAEDRYGRRLAYVAAGGKDLSAELLQAGLAEVYHAADDIARFDEYEELYSQAGEPECAL